MCTGEPHYEQTVQMISGLTQADTPHTRWSWMRRAKHWPSRKDSHGNLIGPWRSGTCRQRKHRTPSRRGRC